MERNRTTPALVVTRDFSPGDKQHVFKSLYNHNVAQTASLLQKPGIDIELVIKDQQGQVFGGIFCDTYLYSMYIDVLWIDERCRGLGYGRALVSEAERIARERGCTMAHTTTFSYQSPGFYQRAGYTVFAELDGYPEGIKQYFLKKAL